MSRWEQDRLKKYISQIRGVSYSPKDTSDILTDEHIAIIRAHNIQDDGLNFDNLVFVSKRRVKEHQYIRKGDIVVCASSGSKSLVGKAAQATEDMHVSFGAFCKVIRTEKIIAPYLGSYFRSKKYRSIISDLSAGANINNLRNEHIDELAIPLPPLETQREIAKTLGAVSEMLAMRKQQLAELDNLIKATFYDMFGDPVANEKGWDIYRLEDITLKIGSGATPRGGKQSYQDNGVSLIRSMNVHNGAFRYDELAHIDDEQARQLDNVIIEENDVLINITGASVARSCAVPKDVLPARVNQHVSIIRPNPDFIMPEYIINMLTFPRYQAHLLALAGTGGATREAITKKQLQQLRIPVPQLDRQLKYALVIANIDEQRTKVQEAVDKIQCLSDSLMSKYFD